MIETISENSMLESRSTMVEIGVRPGESALGRAPEKNIRFSADKEKSIIMLYLCIQKCLPPKKINAGKPQ